ncbi:hypothetical protein Droror1_Dr00022959 [Drosera rotundifolia]
MKIQLSHLPYLLPLLCILLLPPLPQLPPDWTLVERAREENDNVEEVAVEAAECYRTYGAIFAVQHRTDASTKTNENVASISQVQPKLQLQIEEQGKYLLQMFEQQNKMEQEKLKASSSGPLASAADSDEQVASEIDQARAEPRERNSSASKGKQKVTEAVEDNGQQRVADGSFSMEFPPRKCARTGGADSHA